MQGVTAIALVSIVVGGIGWSRREAQGLVPYLEQISFAFVAVIG